MQEADTRPVPLVGTPEGDDKATPAVLDAHLLGYTREGKKLPDMFPEDFRIPAGAVVAQLVTEGGRIQAGVVDTPLVTGGDRNQAGVGVVGPCVVGGSCIQVVDADCIQVVDADQSQWEAVLGSSRMWRLGEDNQPEGDTD